MHRKNGTVLNNKQRVAVNSSSCNDVEITPCMHLTCT